jgi:hypothetical protein
MNKIQIVQQSIMIKVQLYYDMRNHNIKISYYNMIDGLS